MKRLTLLLLLVACGGVQPSDDSNDDEAAGRQHDPGADGDCRYTLEDSCIDEAALAACQAVSVECPGHVEVMESCPLQFSCGAYANEEDPDDSMRPSNGVTLVPCTEGERRAEDCNTCTCEEGSWACTEIDCS